MTPPHLHPAQRGGGRSAYLPLVSRADVEVVDDGGDARLEGELGVGRPEVRRPGGDRTTAVSNGSPPRLCVLMVSGTSCVPGVSGAPRAHPALSSSELPARGIPQGPTCPRSVRVLCITLVRKGLAGPGHVILTPQKTPTDYVPMSILQRARGELLLPEITQVTGGQLRTCILARP